MIDPVIAYSTYVGGNGISDYNGIAVDSTGAAYILGTSVNEQVSDPTLRRDTTNIFVTKISATPIQGTHIRLYSVYFGSPTTLDLPAAIAVDAAGAAYIVGTSRGADFPVKNAFNPTFTGPVDGFLAKIGANPGSNGYELEMASFLGAPATAVAVTPQGAVYVTGNSTNPAFPSLRASPLAISGGVGGYIVKFAASTFERVYSMVFPATLTSVGVDASGAAYIGGSTGNAAYPTLRAAFPNFYYRNEAGSIYSEADGVLTKISATPSSPSGLYDIVYSTFLGGRWGDWILALAVDGASNVYVAGTSEGGSFPVRRQILEPLPRGGFLAKFSGQPDSTGVYPLNYSSFLSLSGESMTPASVGVDTAGGVYVAGSVYLPGSSTYVSIDAPFEIWSRREHGFLMKLRVPDVDDAAIEYSTPIGSRDFDGTPVVSAMKAAVDAAGSAYAVGSLAPYSYVPIVKGVWLPRPDGVSVMGIAIKLSPATPANRMTILSNPPGRRFSISGDGCSPGVRITPATVAFTPGLACVVNFLVTPYEEVNGEYVFSKWEDTGSPQLQRTIIAPDTATTYVGQFTRRYTVSVTSDNPSRGTASAPAGFFAPGSVVPIRATPAFGYAFVRWTGNSPIARYASSSTTVTVGNGPVNLTANFTANFAPRDSSVTPSQFVPVTPCRIVDTRPSAIAAKSVREFAVSGTCGIPANATAYSLNVTVVPKGPLGYLTIFPTGQAQPVVSTLNSLDGRIKANAAIVPAGTNGKVSVYVTDQSDVILDINGYFAAPSESSLAYYPMPPCRILDTRTSAGAPRLAARVTRPVTVQYGNCGVPAYARAYALNATVIPVSTLGFLRLQPFESAPGNTSTLNAVTGTIVANSAIIPSGTWGAIDVYATEDTHLVLDINGYFALPGEEGALNFYPVAPCRMFDSRSVSAMPGGLAAMVNTAPTGCAPPASARVLSLNATVVPVAPVFGFLTLYPPDLQARPTASTLNAIDGALTSNAALIEVAMAQIAAYVSDNAHLILDLNGYFAP